MLPTATLPPLLALAEGSSSNAEDALLLFKIIGGLAGAVMIINGLLSAAVSWRQLRKGEFDGSNFVTKPEHREAHQRIDNLIIEFGGLKGTISTMIKGIADEIKTDMRTVTDQLAGIQRTAGEVDGLKDTVNGHTSDIRDIRKEVMGLATHGTRAK